MGYFDSLASQAFKENPEGDGWLYYPYGILGKGRIVADEVYKNKLFAFQKRMILIGIPLGILYGFSIDIKTLNIYQILAPLLAIFLVHVYQYSLIKNLPISSIKLGYKEAVSKGAKGLPEWYFYFLYITACLVILMGFLMPFLLGRTYKEVLMLVCIPVGIGIASIVMGLFLGKLRKK